MVNNDGGRKFSCLQCGSPYTVYPPESDYRLARTEPCQDGCNKPMNVICQSCRNTITLYWCKDHGVAFIVR